MATRVRVSDANRSSETLSTEAVPLHQSVGGSEQVPGGGVVNSAFTRASSQIVSSGSATSEPLGISPLMTEPSKVPLACAQSPPAVSGCRTSSAQPISASYVVWPSIR